MASKAAVKVGLKVRKLFVDTARKEAAESGERFTAGFLLAAFVETVEGLRQVLVSAGAAAGAADWKEALEEERGGKEEA